MSNFGRILFLAALVARFCFAAASEGSVEERLERLRLPPNEPPAAVSREKLYAVQDRYTPLHWASEVSAGGSENFNSDGFLHSSELSLSYRMHFNDKWSVALSASYVFNSFSAAADHLLDTEGRYPDVTFTKGRGDLVLSYQLFYGKIRFSMDNVLYFDQYLSLGGGVVDMSRGTRSAAVGDIGFVFWLGKWGSLRAGLKDFYYEEPRAQDSHYVHSLLGHLDLGLLIGGA